MDACPAVAFLSFPAVLSSTQPRNVFPYRNALAMCYRMPSITPGETGRGHRSSDRNFNNYMKCKLVSVLLIGQSITYVPRGAFIQLVRVLMLCCVTISNACLNCDVSYLSIAMKRYCPVNAFLTIRAGRRGMGGCGRARKNT